MIAGTVGTILPKDGAFAESGAAMKDVLTAYFANINDKGGIYNRRVGAMGAYVLSIDPAKREFISSGWVSNN